MTALIIIGAVLLILLLIGLLRVGATICFGEETTATLQIGPIKLTVLPKKARKTKKEKLAKEHTAPTEEKEKKTRKLLKLTLDEMLDLAVTAFTVFNETLRRVCRRLRIEPMEVSVVFGGTDPADVARAYGIANAVVWTVMPWAEDVFYLPNPTIHLGMDYEAEATQCCGTVGVSIRIFDLIAILLTMAAPLMKWYRRWKRTHANDPRPGGEAQQEASEETTEKLSA